LNFSATSSHRLSRRTSNPTTNLELDDIFRTAPTLDVPDIFTAQGRGMTQGSTNSDVETLKAQLKVIIRDPTESNISFVTSDELKSLLKASYTERLRLFQLLYNEHNHPSSNLFLIFDEIKDARTCIVLSVARLGSKNKCKDKRSYSD
jgi:hypothetical protein